MKHTISGHFDHYYGNKPVKISLAILYHTTGMDQDLEIKELRRLVRLVKGIDSPVDFIGKHESLPPLEVLPVEVRKVVWPIHFAFMTARQHFTYQLVTCRRQSISEGFVIKNQYEELDQVYDRFVQKRDALRQFTELY